jgi:hypothetical protein
VLALALVLGYIAARRGPCAVSNVLRAVVSVAALAEAASAPPACLVTAIVAVEAVTVRSAVVKAGRQS